MVFFAMASLALPGLNGFVSEFLCLMGVYTADHGVKTGFPGILGPTYAFLAALALILGALYVLRMLQRFVFGPLREPQDAHHGHGSHGGHGDHGASKDLNMREVIAMAPLAIGCIVIGLWPKPFLAAIEPASAKAVAPYVALIERGATAEKPSPGLAAASALPATGSPAAAGEAAQ